MTRERTELATSEEEVEKLKQTVKKLTGELEQSHAAREFKILRATEAVRRRHEMAEENWIEREKHWAREMEELKDRLRKEGPHHPEEVVGQERIPSTARGDGDRDTEEADATLTSRLSEGGHASMLTGLQQVPDLPRFEGGHSGDLDTVEDWLDQLEIIAMAFGWEEGAKLAHLVSRLKGAALTYYRSCPVETQHSYTLLKDALLKRFTPVHVQSMLSSTDAVKSLWKLWMNIPKTCEHCFAMPTRS